MLTNNEKKVLKFLIAAFDSDYSINNIAKGCNLSPNGTFKILKKLEKEGILKAKKIANIKSYKLNFENEKTDSILKLVLIQELNHRIKYRLSDLKGLKNITEACIIFGSYLNKNKKSHDLDILFILDKSRFKEYKKILSDIREIIPVKIHDILQTKNDFKNNILKKDRVILEILDKGVILWGQESIIKTIKDVYKS